MRKITPGPGPVRTDNNTLQVNRWGDTSLQIDTLMRNGSMIVYKAGNSQGYDSRNSSYKDSCSIKLPFVLGTDLSLISSISNETFPVWKIHIKQHVEHIHVPNLKQQHLIPL
jgi:hypothetical protein